LPQNRLGPAPAALISSIASGQTKGAHPTSKLDARMSVTHVVCRWQSIGQMFFMFAPNMPTPHAIGQTSTIYDKSNGFI